MAPFRLLARSSAPLVLLLAAACADQVQVGAFQAHVVPAQLALEASAGFADQSGGGLFVAAGGEPVRLRLDGSRGHLES
ncbi:MAG: hypothetical protein ACK4N5_18150, partial [Myxococcales bacterium]